MYFFLRVLSIKNLVISSYIITKSLEKIRQSLIHNMKMKEPLN
jgi:hypothetical protein